MSNFLIDECGNHVWYDLRSDYPIENQFILYNVNYQGEQIFYVRPHREDGPAIIVQGGLELYYNKGQKHREDGPAEFSAHGIIEWWLNDIEYTFKDWCEKLENSSEEEINFLKLKWNTELK